MPSSILATGMIALLRVYKRFVSPLLPSACRFAPTCSVYAMQAIERFGAVRGMWLGLKRIGRCHSFCEGGHDPVPNHPDGSDSLDSTDPGSSRNNGATGLV